MPAPATSASSITRFLRLGDQPPITRKISPETANLPKILFSFKYYNVGLSGFNLREDVGFFNNRAKRIKELEIKIEKLVGVFHLLSSKSKECSDTIGEKSHCHTVGNEKLNACGLKDMVNYFPDKVFFQMGIDETSKAERIFGFFEKGNDYIFQVTVIDLDHKVYD